VKFLEIRTVLLGPTLTLAALVLLNGCQTPAKEPPETTRPARSEVQRGPVKVIAQVVPKWIRLSDDPKLILTIEHEKGVTVKIPPFAQSFGQFHIKNTHKSMPRSVENREIIQQTYTLEPKTTGTLAIWPIAVHFNDTRPNGDGKRHTLKTQEFTVDVISNVDPEKASIADMKPASDPIDIPTPVWATLIWLIVGGVVILVGVLTWLRISSRSKVVEKRPLTPKELAFWELQKIVDEDLAKKDVKLFYVELTGVVRRYIERTTSIRAPEQTTEEFLREITTCSTFPPEEGQRLRNFLESADLVKFAALEPIPADIRESFNRAEVFIGIDQDQFKEPV